MALSTDDIKTIKQYADKLEKWAENLSYNTGPAGNLWVELTLLLYPQDVQSIAFWLGNIPTTGQNIRKELEELSKLVQEVDAWRNQGIYPEDLGEFCARIHKLMKITRNIVSILRTLSGSGEGDPILRTNCKMGTQSEPPETKVIAVEKSNAPETQQTNPASIEPACTPDKTLSKEALMAYELHCKMGLPIQQVAKRMTAELKLDKALRPWQISRWIKQVENGHKHTRIPIRSIAPRTSGTTVRSAQIDAAAQADHNKT
jgi:hypothetical protein